jgi:[CysO sulfur-carrier protein]-S-L-cysteine hydrolase
VSDVLVVPRRLAVQLLHEAQISPDAPIEGLVGARNAEPAAVYPLNGAITRAELLQKLQANSETAWAWYRSNPQQPAAPVDSDKFVAADRAYSLIISLDTKGVLEMRCWDWSSGAPVEREIKIKD